jgi:hypothetical protein|tara:strand:- start:2084 stop:2299 length:216 start_codon:yes stop_codon:yes gene_type:complete
MGVDIAKKNRKKTKKLYKLILGEIANLHETVDEIHSKQLLPVSSVKRKCIAEYTDLYITPLMLIYKASISK